MRIDGLLIVDKPQGMTSLDVVREVKLRFHVKKAGHIGTLDPFATGVLPVALNEGTKLVPFIKEDPKAYDAVMKLGEETTTDDLTGDVVLKKTWNGVTPGTIYSVSQAFCGKIRQIPPMFSAIKLKGKPLYRLARKGITVERREREIDIYDLQIKEVVLPQVRFSVTCSRGTYIRALARDMGRKIGCGAHLLSLRRTQSGPFILERAIPWERLQSLSGAEDLVQPLISLREALPGLPEMVGDERLVKKVRFGKEMMVGDLLRHSLPPFERGEWLKMYSPEQELVAILKSEMKGEELRTANPGAVALRPLRIFHPSLEGEAGKGEYRLV